MFGFWMSEKDLCSLWSNTRKWKQSKRKHFTGSQWKYHWNARRVTRPSATSKMQTNSDCMSNIPLKESAFCSLLLRSNTTILELVWVQKIIAPTYVTEIHSTFIFDNICEQCPSGFCACQLAHLWFRFTLHFLLSVNTTFHHCLGLINTEGDSRTVTNLQEQEAAVSDCTCLFALSWSLNTPVYLIHLWKNH